MSEYGRHAPEMFQADMQDFLLLEHAKDKVEELSPFESKKYADITSRKRGRKGIEDAIARGILEMAAATKQISEAIKKFNDSFSITDCVRALDELQGVNVRA